MPLAGDAHQDSNDCLRALEREIQRGDREKRPHLAIFCCRRILHRC